MADESNWWDDDFGTANEPKAQNLLDVEEEQQKHVDPFETEVTVETQNADIPEPGGNDFLLDFAAGPKETEEKRQEINNANPFATEEKRQGVNNLDPFETEQTPQETRNMNPFEAGERRQEANDVNPFDAEEKRQERNNGDPFEMEFTGGNNAMGQAKEEQENLESDMEPTENHREVPELRENGFLLDLEPAEDKQHETGDEHEDRPKIKKMQSVIETPAAPEVKSEAQLIIEAKQRKREEEDMEELLAQEEKRRAEREKEEEELRRLKEKQAQRKKEREEEERRLEEQKQLAEEQRKKDEESRRQKAEEERQRKQEEAERKKAAAIAAASGGRNFVVDKEKTEDSSVDKFMNVSKAKTEMSLNTNELEALKEKTINDRVKPLSISELDNNGLKAKADELWKTINKLETTNYDLGDRLKRQDYDLRELNERQRQISHKKHLAQGLDPEAASSRFPPKVQLVSKYERRTDRRTFEERKSLFEQEKKGDGPKELVKPVAKKRDDWIKPKETKSREDKYIEQEEDRESLQERKEPDSFTLYNDSNQFTQESVQNNQEKEEADSVLGDIDEEEGKMLSAPESRKSSGYAFQAEPVESEETAEEDFFTENEQNSLPAENLLDI